MIMDSLRGPPYVGTPRREFNRNGCCGRGNES